MGRKIKENTGCFECLRGTDRDAALTAIRSFLSDSDKITLTPFTNSIRFEKAIDFPFDI